MANYNAVHRTNYFRVNDEEKWKEWFSCLCGTQDFTKTDEDGTVWHGFGDYGSSPWYERYDEETGEGHDGTFDIDDSIEILQDMLPDDQAFVYTEVGYEKLRYVAGWSLVVTNQGIEVVDLCNGAIDTAEKLLKKQNGEGFEFKRDGFRDNMVY